MLKNPFGKFFRTIPILLLVLVSGCSPRAETTDFSLEEARVFKVTSFQVLNQITLGQAGMISFLNENEVVVADMCFPSLLSRINIQTGESNHFLKMGRGPGECIDINCLTVQDGKLFVFSPSSRKMIIMQESSEDKQVFSLEKEIQINENCLRMIPTKTGKPAIITVASVASVAYMKMTIKTRLMISRIILMMPLDRISDTEFT